MKSALSEMSPQSTEVQGSGHLLLRPFSASSHQSWKGEREKKKKKRLILSVAFISSSDYKKSILSVLDS